MAAEAEAEQRKHDAALCGSADGGDEPGVRAALEAGATPSAVKPSGWPAARRNSSGADSGASRQGLRLPDRIQDRPARAAQEQT